VLEEPTSSIQKVLSEKKPMPLNALVIDTSIEDMDKTAINSELYHQKKLIDEEVAEVKALCASLGQDPAIVDIALKTLTDPETAYCLALIKSFNPPSN
jgi:hypothetical protein